MQESDLKILFEREGVPVPSGSNHRFFIQDPESVWYVVTGRVDIFSVKVHEGEQTGARYYFFTVDAGELIFGLNSGKYGQGRALLAVGTPGTVLFRLPTARLRECAGKPSFRKEIASLMDQWIQGLSSGISKDINPETNLLIEQASHVEILDNIKFRAKKEICWIRFMKGNGLFIGIKEVADQGPLYLFPVTRNAWIQTIEPCEVFSCPTQEAMGQDRFWEGLELFYEIVFFCEMLNTRLIMVDELNRLSDKATDLERTREGAFHRIASVLNKAIGPSYLLADETPLISVCRIVAGYSGIGLAIPDLPDPEKMRDLSLEDIVRSSRIRMRQVALPEQWWKKDFGPVIAFTREKVQPVAVIPSGNNRYTLINPQNNEPIPVNQAVAGTLKPLANQLYRPFPDQCIKGRDLFRFSLKGTRSDMTMILFAGITGGLLTLLLPVLTGVIFDRIIPQSDHRELFLFAVAIFVSALATGIFQVVRSFALIRIETKIDFNLQNALWDRILNLPVSFFKRFSSGELASKANSLSVLRKILSNTVIYSIVSGTFGIFNYFLLFAYDPILALITSVILLLSLGLFGYVGLKIQKNQRHIIQQQNTISGLLIQFLNSISKLKIAGAEVSAYARWAERFSRVKHATLAIKKYSNGLQVFMSVLPVLASLILFATIAYNKRINLSTGEFMAFFTAFTMTVGIILQIGMAGISFFNSIPLFENVKPILETLPENEKFKHEVATLQGEIELNHVSFRYEPESPLVIKDISLHIAPGEYVAIAGSSGSGKSTLLRLLLGFEKPETGAIYYDRQDLANLDPASVRRQIGSVLQETRLAPGNILTNIIGVSNITMDDAWEAARRVGLDEDIHQMPMGMFTIVSDGLSTLSGGQRQRVLIARALVTDPRILLLDEATSALDNETQRTVARSLETIQATRLVIAHRLSTIKNADRIFVLDKGQLVEEGNYDQLMKKAGTFYDLVKRQSV